jgi:subtilisin family serine protease
MVDRSGSPRKIDVGITLGRAGTPFDEDSAGEIAEWIKWMLPDKVVDEAVALLISHGFEITGRSRCTLSLRAPPELFEHYFSSRLDIERLSGPPGAPATYRVTIGKDLRIPERFKDVIGTVTIQPPSRNQVAVSATPPAVVPAAYFLSLDDVSRVLGASAVRGRFTGAGVRLTMIDTGFEFGHPFFAGKGLQTEVLLAGGAHSRDKDGSGHGTGCSANVFAVAPGVDFTGIKIGDDVDGVDGSAPLLVGFQRALGFDPDHPGQRSSTARPLPKIISVSVSCGEKPGTPRWNNLPSDLTPLEACVREAVLAFGITVVAAAGNDGERGFPGQMKHVISVGGVFKPKQGPLRASSFASAFTSRVYGGRKVPDVCGLCGERTDDADYIMLPVPAGSDHDREFGVVDGTGKQDGWARFSGTSAATPQVAAVCALLLEKNPGLTPPQLKSILMATATDVDQGNAAGMDGNKGLPAIAKADSATGAGLVNAVDALARA